MPGRPQQSDADKERDERERVEALAKRRKAEADNLIDWRRRKLAEAGFSDPSVELILSWETNPTGAAPIYQEALRLRGKGCPADLALDMLRPDALPASGES